MRAVDDNHDLCLRIYTNGDLQWCLFQNCGTPHCSRPRLMTSAQAAASHRPWTRNTSFLKVQNGNWWIQRTHAIKSYPLGMGEFPTIQKFTDWDCYLYFSLPEFKIHSSSVYQICSSQLSSISSISRFLQVLSSVKSEKEAQVALPKCQVPQKPRVFYSMVPSRITILGYSISTMLRTALAPGPVGV